MSDGFININAKDFVVLTKKLEDIHRSALPVAIRQTLNDLAFDVKQDTALNQFDENFVNRKKNFFKSHSTVNKSPNTFNLREMVSEAGIVKGKSKSGDLLNKQEFGGSIANRAYLPTKEARIGKKPTKLMKKKNRLNQLSKKQRVVLNKKDLIRSAFIIGVGGLLLYKNILFEVARIARVGKRAKMRLVPLYLYKRGHSAKINKKPFMEPAMIKTTKKTPKIFTDHAAKRFEKYGFK